MRAAGCPQRQARDCIGVRVNDSTQLEAVEAGKSSPDFAAENYEVDFEGRCTADMLSPLGRVQMGYEM